MRVAIIGAGPSGLTTLKYLVTANQYFNGLEPITVRLFERHRDIGGTFRFRTYRDSEVSDTSSGLAGQEIQAAVHMNYLRCAAFICCRY